MLNLFKMNKKEMRISVKYTNKIRKRFQKLNVPLSKRTEGIPTDLGDIREACLEYLNALEIFLSPAAQKNKKVLIEIFKYIIYQFDFHVKYHLKELQKTLDILIRELERKEKKGKANKR
ncbi:MAG: hypothetical protein HY253_12975 [Burkholderiales bacterium]|nr:hypothetical protein [Burkholderiales bacterium]